MWSNESIVLRGRNGRSIFNRYYRQSPRDGKTGLTVIIVPGADHALETGDPIESLRHLTGYVKILKDFYSPGSMDEGKKRG